MFRAGQTVAGERKSAWPARCAAGFANGRCSPSGDDSQADDGFDFPRHRRGLRGQNREDHLEQTVEV